MRDAEEIEQEAEETISIESVFPEYQAIRQRLGGEDAIALPAKRIRLFSNAAPHLW
jgi:hypothetical protein